MRTVITHFYNEEYLLPRWLEHHKKLFDHGILIDYNSTDNSVAICKEICPTWQVQPSYNKIFDSKLCDEEVIMYERRVLGWRIALTVTEFLVGDIDSLTEHNKKSTEWRIPRIRFAEWDLERTIDEDKPLWEQFHMGSHLTDKESKFQQCRLLHNCDYIQYIQGRHYSSPNTDAAYIFHYANCIVGKPMLDRRLQIQKKVSLRDRNNGDGWQHYYHEKNPKPNAVLTKENLFQLQKNIIEKDIVDCTDIIKKYTT